QGIQFTLEGNPRGTALQATAIACQGDGRLSQVFVAPAEVEQRERIAGTLAVLKQKQLKVALDLAAVHAGVLVSQVLDIDVRRPDSPAGAFHSGLDLLVNA